jgi:hypothetical protein
VWCNVRSGTSNIMSKIGLDLPAIVAVLALPAGLDQLAQRIALHHAAS